MTTIQERKKCTFCKVNILLTEFKPKRDGTTTKRCIKCLDYNVKWQRKNKCVHNRRKSSCKECPNASGICEHNRHKSSCKECPNASGICEHNRKKSTCKECPNASGICEHNRRKSSCKECPNASGICEHNREKSSCKECSGSQICEHNRRKSTCKECPNASGICEHNRQKRNCKECPNASGICEHNRRKSKCKECDPIGHLRSVVSSRIYSALKSDKSEHSIEYLGCPIEELKEHIENQFTEGMTWENYGEWHIDHIIPIKYENPTLEESAERLHWTNTQPLWASENIAKGNRYIG